MPATEHGRKLPVRKPQPWFGGAVGAALAVAVGLVLLFYDYFGKGLRDRCYDLPFVAMNQPSDDVVVVLLDETTYRDLKQTPADFDRGLHAQLVRQLQAQGARMIVFDVLFIDSKKADEKGDAEFAAAMKSFGHVVLGAQYQQHAGHDYDLMTPVDPLHDACAGWGIAKVHLDTDFTPRRHYEVTERVPSLGWKSAQLAGAPITLRPEERLRERWLNYYSPTPFVTVSYVEALQGKQLPSGVSFKGKVVFVGSGSVAGYTGNEREEFRSPWTWRTGHYVLGVEVHALTFSNLMRGDWLRRTSDPVEAVRVIVLGIALGYGLSLLRPLAATGAALGFVAAFSALAFLLFAKAHLWFPWLIPVAVQAPVALFWSYVFNSVKAYTETRLLEASLALYLSPQQARRILKQPELLKPGARMDTITILFSDIANFSKISQRMGPEDLVRLLNSYYETAIACVHETDGTVVKLIGDAILAIWNAPESQPDHFERGCRSAILLNEKLAHFEAASTSLPLHTRVGLHTGDACVGNIGSSTRFDYTAIGDAVNLASRLEGLNKQLGTKILISREGQRALDGKIVSRLVGHFKFKGFDSVTEVHELLSNLDSSERSKSWRESFARGLWNFQRKQFAEAEVNFRQTLSLRSDDGPAAYYLERIAELRTSPLRADWMGEIDLREK